MPDQVRETFRVVGVVDGKPLEYHFASRPAAEAFFAGLERQMPSRRAESWAELHLPGRTPRRCETPRASRQRERESDGRSP